MHAQGRSWILDDVHAWMESPVGSTDQFRWYTGKKDLGKSSVAAYQARNRPSVIAYHFAHAGDRSRSDARRAVLSLCYQVGMWVALCPRCASAPLPRPLHLSGGFPKGGFTPAVW